MFSEWCDSSMKQISQEESFAPRELEGAVLEGKGRVVVDVTSS